jgi:hypothetical protein
MHSWEIIADRLSERGLSWGLVSCVASDGRTIFVVDAAHPTGSRFIVRSDELLTAFSELERRMFR